MRWLFFIKNWLNYPSVTTLSYSSTPCFENPFRLFSEAEAVPMSATCLCQRLATCLPSPCYHQTNQIEIHTQHANPGPDLTCYAIETNCCSSLPLTVGFFRVFKMRRTQSTVCLILLFVVFSSSAKEGETEEDRLRRCWMMTYNKSFDVTLLIRPNDLNMVTPSCVQVLRLRHWMWGDEEMLHSGFCTHRFIVYKHLKACLGPASVTVLDRKLKKRKGVLKQEKRQKCLQMGENVFSRF